MRIESRFVINRLGSRQNIHKSTRSLHSISKLIVLSARLECSLCFTAILRSNKIRIIIIVLAEYTWTVNGKQWFWYKTKTYLISMEKSDTFQKKATNKSYITYTTTYEWKNETYFYLIFQINFLVADRLI